jgi:putative phosphoesterase
MTTDLLLAIVGLLTGLSQIDRGFRPVFRALTATVGVLVALSDTHADGPPPLTDHLREQLAAADVVVHAGDFTSTAALDTFEEITNRLVAVRGNADTIAVTERLPETATVEAFGRRVLVVHGDGHDETSLSLLARQESADVVVTGHTHRPGIGQFGSVGVLNPGSHADPRGSRPAYAMVGHNGRDVFCQLRTPAGESIERRQL